MRIDLSKRELELLLVLVSNALAEDAEDLAQNGIDPRQFDLVDKLENALRYSVMFESNRSAYKSDTMKH